MQNKGRQYYILAAFVLHCGRLCFAFAYILQYYKLQ